MFPRPSVANSSYCYIMNAECFCNFSHSFSRCSQPSYFRDVALSKLRIPRRLTFCSSVFRNSVLNVLQLGSKEKMVWIYTCRIVAFMANAHSFRNGSVGNFPSPSVAGLVAKLHCYKDTVSILFFVASPEPARSGFINSSPKVLDWVASCLKPWKSSCFKSKASAAFGAFPKVSTSHVDHIPTVAATLPKRVSAFQSSREFQNKKSSVSFTHSVFLYSARFAFTLWQGFSHIRSMVDCLASAIRSNGWRLRHQDAQAPLFLQDV